MRTKEELLSMSAWTYHEIMDYFPNIKSKTTAIRVKQRAINEMNGSIPYGTQYVKSDSVLALYGTSRENELSILRKEPNYEKDN